MALKILFWNIQNFGKQRSSRSDVIKNVARIIDAADADIVCIQELQVSKWKDIKTVVGKVKNALQNDYEYILCPYNGFEMYLYLYKKNVVSALVLDEDEADEVTSDSLSSCNFSVYAGSTKKGNEYMLAKYFPLLAYEKCGKAARLPGIGFFRYVNNSGTHNIALLQWHNDASGGKFIYGNISRLARTGIISNGTMTIKVGNNNLNLSNVVIGGDFNDDLSTNPFTSYTRLITDKTHLQTFDKDQDGDFNGSMSLRDYLLDNILYHLPGNLSSTGSGIMDLPLILMNARNGTTKNDLSNSNLIAKSEVQKEYRVKMVQSLSNKKYKSVKISKISKMTFGNMLKDTNLLRVRSQTMGERIHRLQIPDIQKQVIKRVAMDFLKKHITLDSRWASRLQNMDGLLWNDTLFLSRHWMSDHLPVFITLN